ncbi:hypothetical protein [Kordia sp.]|uniref:hypothetical protein n=1 Tax=Kordia sp. TaxID=1965332 RepID=UPI003B599D1F
MKKIILSFTIIILLFSCSKKEQYYGTWTLGNNYADTPYCIKIDSNSISISNDETLWNTYPVSIKNNSLTFLNHTFKTSISEDSLMFDNITYKKYTKNPLINIKLPKLENFNSYTPNPETELIYIKFGKVPKSNEFKLQLNDRYAKPEELIDFFFSHYNEISHHGLKRIMLICDSNSKMGDLEPLFHEMIKINAIVFYPVNDIKFSVSNNKIVHKYKLSRHIITPIHNMTVEKQVGENIVLTNHTYIYNDNFLKQFKLKKISCLFLINNEFYIGKKKYDSKIFAKKVHSLITNNTQLITMFDSNSNFKDYIQFNEIIKNSYHQEYSFISKQKYNTVHKQLNKEQKAIVRETLPYRNIENLSIPYFLSLEESCGDNADFLFKNVKEQIPEVYFEK